jgi:hypothetical protein
MRAELLNGTAALSEDTTAPYATHWNTGTFALGQPHAGSSVRADSGP